MEIQYLDLKLRREIGHITLFEDVVINLHTLLKHRRTP